MRSKGKTKSGNNKKSFGFVAPFRGEKQIFIHISAFSNRYRPPRIGDVVTYTASKDKKGRPCATKTAFAGEKIKAKPQRTVRSWIIVVALIFMLGVGLLVLPGKIPIVILALYAGISVLTFLVYAFDKSAAKRGLAYPRKCVARNVAAWWLARGRVCPGNTEPYTPQFFKATH